MIFDLSMDGRLLNAGKDHWEKILNLGAGILPIDGIINHDGLPGPKIDLVFDLTKFPWPIKDQEYDKVCAFHLMEHIPIQRILPVFKELWRIISPAGHLIIELPDFEGMVKQYINGDAGMIDRIYGTGLGYYDLHKWGWTRSQLAFISRVSGFPQCVTKTGTDYHSNQLPTLRLEAIKSDREAPHF